MSYSTNILTPLAVKLSLHKRDNKFHIVNREILELLQNDVTAIEEYRKKSYPVCVETLKLWFPNVADIEKIFNWLDVTRDFIYTKYGLYLLIKHYLYRDEPIQYAMLRIAKIFSAENNDFWHIMYDLLSCGMIHVSSIFDPIKQDNYDNNNIYENNKISALINFGVEAAYGAKNLSSTINYSDDKINNFNNTTLNNKYTKTILYIPIHNDTIFDAMGFKLSSNNINSNNIVLGLMIPDYFIKCVEDNKPWYLFASTTKLNNKTLSDYTSNEYVKMYEKWIDAKLYTKKLMARSIMSIITKSIILCDSPSIIWSDNINRYNNLKHLGIIKKLDSCAAQTTNLNNDNLFLFNQIICNMAMYKDFPDVIENGEKFIFYNYGIYNHCEDFELPELARYGYTIGYLSTIALNNYMGEYKKNRDIGLNLIGVYDMALMAYEDNIKVCRVVSEALYKGAVQSSCDYYLKYGVICDNYDGSEFSKGRPQWSLRNNKPISDWSLLIESMKYGMANSMLTSQSTTTTICLLIGVAESVGIPINYEFLSNDMNKNDYKCISYGIICRSINYINLLMIPNDVDSQFDMYAASLDFIDHSQSTIFPINLNEDKLIRLIFKTFYGKFKTAIYSTILK